jgi:hypothetical protein
MADLERNRQLVIQRWDASYRRDVDAVGAVPAWWLEHTASGWVEQA